jgi:serine/threonine protein kinase
VYRTWQLAVGRETAVKVDSRVLQTERDQRRFLREVTAAGRLSGHPHVIDLYDAGTLGDGRPYLVMELCPAGSLRDELRRNGPMNAERVSRIGADLADALAAAHAAGILHRDIKPGNILINPYGFVGLSDFGLASIIAASGEQSVSREALTPAYAPPETFGAAEPTVAADLYSLAATLYALLAGRPPRYSDDTQPASPAAMLALHSRPIADIPGVPPRLIGLLRQCLSADPGQRLPSAAVFRDALTGIPGPRVAARFVPPGETGSSSGTDVSSSTPTPDVWTVPDAWSEPGSSVRNSWAGSTSEGVKTTARPRRPRRRRTKAVTVAASGILVAVAVAAGIIGSRIIGSGTTVASTSPPGAIGGIGTFGIATTTSDCPAAAVPGAAARCPAAPECWQGLVEIETVITATPLPCTGPHSWQTFAIGIMPSAASTYNVNIVQANSTVHAVCSASVLRASLKGRARLIPESRWTIQVLPPDEAAYDSGVRTYRCLASLGLNISRTSQFGP